MAPKKLLLIKIALFISYHFSKKLTCTPRTQRFEKAHESKYQNTSPDLAKMSST